MFILIFILILVALIVVHEFGHFIVAKLFGIRVDEFGIFFPPRLLSFTKGETTYSINSLPLGGFVKIFGENYDEGHGALRSFVSKPRYVQAAVILAGIAFNLLFAWLILSAGYMAGLPASPEQKALGPVTDSHVLVSGTLPNSPAAKAGLMSGDQIEMVQTATEKFDLRPLNSGQAANVTKFISAHPDESVVLTVLRNGKEENFLAKAEEGVIGGRKAIGLQLQDIGILKLSPVLALGQGAMLAYDITANTAAGLLSFFKNIFTATANFNDVAGPIGITVYGAAAIQHGFATAVLLTALISINLALINLLPIPGLDGGRLFIIIIESIIRRPVSPAIVLRFTIAGFALLVTLMVVVSYHDIVKLIG